MDVSEFFSTGKHGHILISTRNPNVTIHANAGFRGMDPDDGIDLLLKSAYILRQLDEAEPQKRNLASSVAAELRYLAIALDQAGATIRRKIHTLERYLRSSLAYRHRLLSSQEQVFTSEANVITTWEIPFKQIELRRSTEYEDAVTLMHILRFSISNPYLRTFFMPHGPQWKKPKMGCPISSDLTQGNLRWHKYGFVKRSVFFATIQSLNMIPDAEHVRCIRWFTDGLEPG
jgi:hypothetical protein